jgi:hypothetical protein
MNGKEMSLGSNSVPWEWGVGSLENSAICPDKLIFHSQVLTSHSRDSTDNQHQIVEQHQNFRFS